MALAKRPIPEVQLHSIIYCHCIFNIITHYMSVLVGQPTLERTSSLLNFKVRQSSNFEVSPHINKTLSPSSLFLSKDKFLPGCPGGGTGNPGNGGGSGGGGKPGGKVDEGGM